MERAEKFIHFDSKDKKRHTVASIEMDMVDKWGVGYYRKYKNMIPLIIEFIIDTTKKNRTLNINV